MTERNVELFEAASVRLKYAGLKAGDRTLILADTYTHKPLLDAVYTAAVALGADATVMEFRARQQPFNWELPPIIENAIYNVDFTYSVMSQGWRATFWPCFRATRKSSNAARSSTSYSMKPA